MKKYRESIKNVSEELQILKKWFGDPIDIAKFRSALVADWYPFVGNRATLDFVVRTGTHNWEYAFFLQIKEDNDLWVNFTHLFDILQKSRSKEPQLFAESFKHFWDSEHKAIRDFSDHFHLERGKSESPDLLSVKIAFQEIGISLESCVQPFARHYLTLHILAESKKFLGFDSIDKLSFGNVVDQLANIDQLSSLYKPIPWNISLNQWRNIGQHSSFEFEESTNRINCHYGLHPNIQNIEISYPELLYLCYLTNTIFFFHKIAYSIFSLGIPEIIHKLAQTTKITYDSIATTVTEILTTYSFKIIMFSWQSSPWQIEAVDQVGHSEKIYQQIINELYGVCSIRDALKFELFISLKNTSFTRTITIGPCPIG